MINEHEKVILLVEDNKDDADLTVMALREEARLLNPIVVVKDGAQALDYLMRRGVYEGRVGGHPQVMLLDLNLPKITGHEVLRRVRAEPSTRGLPVVVLTTSKEDEDICRSYDLGANSYVRKPVEFERFTEAVRSLASYWLLLNECPTGDAHGARPTKA